MLNRRAGSPRPAAGERASRASWKRRALPALLVSFVLLALVVLIARPLTVGAANKSPLAAAKHHHRIHFFKPHHTRSVVASGNNLVYGGGPVMSGTAQVYLIFWEPTGSTVSATYNDLITRYFQDVGGTGLYNNNTQYTDSSGGVPGNASLAGSWVDTSSYPSTSLSDGDVQNEVSKALTTNGWTSDVTHIFFVFTAKDENICDSSQCSFSSFCAYHSYFGTNTVYAAMPYAGTNLSVCGTPGSPNNDADADATINVTSHEQMEAATDPLLNAWIDSSGQEIVDKCAWNFGTTNADGSNVSWNGHPYLVQQEWDNAQSGCVLSGP